MGLLLRDSLYEETTVFLHPFLADSGGEEQDDGLLG